MLLCHFRLLLLPFCKKRDGKLWILKGTVSILMGPTFLVWNHSLNFINMVVLKRFNFSPRKKPINLWWRRTGISKPGIPELSTLSLKPYLFTQSNQRITNVLFWRHCLKQNTWNPTIFNIIRWDDRLVVPPSDGPILFLIDWE